LDNFALSAFTQLWTCEQKGRKLKVQGGSPELSPATKMVRDAGKHESYMRIHVYACQRDGMALSCLDVVSFMVMESAVD
jgi:hypothetical protein